MKLDFSSERVQRRAAASVSSACSSRAYIYCLLELNMQGIYTNRSLPIQRKQAPGRTVHLRCLRQELFVLCRERHGGPANILGTLEKGGGGETLIERS